MSYTVLRGRGFDDSFAAVLEGFPEHTHTILDMLDGLETLLRLHPEFQETLAGTDFRVVVADPGYPPLRVAYVIDGTTVVMRHADVADH